MSTPTARLVVCFDGTNNTASDRTNVWRIHELLADLAPDGVPQRKCYIQGVGTEMGERVAGSVFGATVSSRIREGYRWLVDNYQPDAEIFVFGFSRGAFSARSLVQFLANCGLTHGGALKQWSVQRAFDRYEAITRQESMVVKPLWQLRRWDRHPEERPPGWEPDETERLLLDPDNVRAVSIRMAGLWDTVGAIGANALKDGAIQTQKAAEHNVRPTRLLQHGYHALAIDEHRPMFDVTLWRSFIGGNGPPGADDHYSNAYEQRWFVGAHSDVGGGYEDDRLPDLSLAWMMDQSRALGLGFTHTIEPSLGAWHAPVHDSFEAFAGSILSLWDKVMPGDQRNYREIGRAPRKVTTAEGSTGHLWSIRETIDESVKRRWIEDPTYRPPNLVDYFRRNPGELPDGTRLGQRTQRIYARNYWNETGVFLKKDQRYRIRVVPGVGEPLRDEQNKAGSIRGEDWDSLAYRVAESARSKRLDEARWFALIGTVEKDHPFVIEEGMVYSPPVSGQMLCYFNDVSLEAFYKNNSGWVLLDVEAE